MKSIALAVAATTLLASTGFAADMAVKAPSAVSNDWSGFYLGAHAGYGWGHDPFQESLADQPDLGLMGSLQPFPGPVISGINSRGYVAGGHVGYNWQRRDWVGGVEFDLSATGIKGSNSNTVNVTAFVPGVTTFVGTNSATAADKFDLLGSARARLGMLVSPDLLLYGTGGFTWTRFTRGLTDVVTITAGPGVGGLPPTSTAFSSTSSWRYGWAAGIGGEYKMFDGWLVRLEYLHYDFGDSGNQQPQAVAPAGGVNTGTASTALKSFTSGNLTLDVVRAGLSYKF